MEIYKITLEMGFDITLATNEFILAELFKKASEENRLNELGSHLLELFNSRLSEYTKLKNLYPKADKPISIWIRNCEKTIEKLKKQISEEG
jgi:hypothetical protein